MSSLVGLQILKTADAFEKARLTLEAAEVSTLLTDDNDDDDI